MQAASVQPEEAMNNVTSLNIEKNNQEQKIKKIVSCSDVANRLEKIWKGWFMQVRGLLSTLKLLQA